MQPSPIFKIRNPAGVWRCTHSTFDGFVVGREYACLTENNGSYRIYPLLHQNAWSPYWEAHRGRFCYRPDELDFVFVRPFKPSEEGRLIYQRDRTPAPRLPPHISFPLEFAEDEPAAPPRRPSKLAALLRRHARDGAVFTAGVAVATIACLAI